MSDFVDVVRAARIAEEIQEKYFVGRWNHEVMAICCILLADELADAEGVDRDAILDDLVKQIKKFVALSVVRSEKTEAVECCPDCGTTLPLLYPCFQQACPNSHR